MQKHTNSIKREKRIRNKIRATGSLPRLSINRSSAHISAQIIDDIMGKTLLGLSEKSLQIKGTKTEKAKALGIALAKAAKEKKVTAVVFDKGAYRYHGRVKAVAEGAREGGLQF